MSLVVGIYGSISQRTLGVTEINATALAQLFGITGDGADATNLTVVAKHGEITDGLNFTVPTAGTDNVYFHGMRPSRQTCM